MKKHTAFTLLVLFVIIVMPLSSQSTQLPYFNGWENPVENGKWIMNSGMNGSTASNRWYVSSKDHFSGSHSLLISDLSVSPDTAAVYSDATVNIVAARTFNLPAGTYDLSFSYRMFGEKNCDGLYVAWIPDNADISTTLTVPPAWVSTSAPYNGRMFCNRMSWTVEKTTITSVGRPMKLAFLWVNDGKNAASPSVSIDNVQIAQNSCGQPVNITSKVSSNDIDISWTENPDASYEVWYTSDHTGLSDTIHNVRGGSLRLPDMPKGAYNFHIRTVCAPGDTGIWCSLLKTIVNENLCLDYANLRGDGVTCYIGDVNDQYQEIFVDDKGINGEPPRHTVNTDIYETDPRTGGNLKVIPDGDFISVRLGNENIAKGEAIVYDMHLDSGANTVLLMKYAIVLQVPEAHKESEMPWFKLEILDKDGNLIDPTCGSIYFFSDLALLDEGWYVHQLWNEQNQNYEPLIYKDWTTMGVMLGDYAKNGPTDIKVRLTTRDCTQMGHFGYAYFTLDCIGGEIDGLTCGDIPTEKVSAPAGFDYKWYREDDPDMNIVSDSMVLEVRPGDIGTYKCDVISRENPNCYFTLTASLLPRFPKAEVEPVWVPDECLNYLRFNNMSYIETEKGRSDEEITSFEWDFGDGRTSVEKNPHIPVSQKGDTLKVSLKASIVDGMCWDVWDSTIVVPAVGEVYDTTYVTICKGGQPHIINGMPYYDSEDVTLPPVVSAVTGCDSLHTVRITAVESYVDYIDTVLCYGDTLVVGGTKFGFSGTFKKVLRSVGGCDSIINITLSVLPEVTFSADAINATGGPRSGAIILKDTLPGTHYTLNGEPNARLDSLAEGSYTIICYNEIDCASEPLTVEIVPICPEFVVEQAGDVCAGDSVFYLSVTASEGTFRHYGLSFGGKERIAGFVDADGLVASDGYAAVPLPDSVRPDNYYVNLIILGGACGDDTLSVPFTVLYPKSVMAQKWNDVVAVTNENYNGGYIFSSFRWYRNGILVEGENNSYIYLGEGAVFNEGDEFRVELTRVDDDVRVMSCPLVVEPHNDVRPYPSVTVAPALSKVEMKNVTSTVEVKLWSVSGVYGGMWQINSDNPFFTAPHYPGVYILEVIFAGESVVHKIIVR